MMEFNKIYCGNTLDVLKTFPDESINCCVTSPPYWALRDYGTDGVVWDGDPECEHEWGKPNIHKTNLQAGNPEFQRPWRENASGVSQTNFCNKCGAWKGQLGLEPDFNLYIKHLCDIFDEVKRVLRKDGTCWVNLGDTYNSHSANSKNVGGFEGKQMRNNAEYANTKIATKKFIQLPDKSLCNIPSRFSIEMQNRGWILRNKIIWHKPNCMPSSVTDRFTVDYEEIFFFVKNKKYFFEQQFEEVQIDSIKRACRARTSEKVKANQYAHSGTNEYIGYDDMMGKMQRGELSHALHPQGRNKRTVWKISTKGYKGAHFAVFPQELIETPIKAGCPKEICMKCGKAREKIIAKREYIVDEKEPSNKFKDAKVNSAGGRAFTTTIQRRFTPNQKDVAKYLKSKINDKDLLDEEFGQHTWTHWVRTDESGASLPNPEQYLILKDMLGLDDRFDAEMLTTVQITSDDKGGKTEVIGYSKCDCDAPFVAGIVLDPFMGSGTTAVFCEKNRYKWIGCEVSDKYCEMIKGRLEPYNKQTRLM